jgi:hypothetical protein
MRITLKPFFVTVALVAICGIANAAQMSPEEQLAAAEAKWAMNRPHAL